MTGEGRTGEERTGQENPKTKKQLGLDVLVTCLVKIFKNPDNCKFFLTLIHFLIHLTLFNFRSYAQILCLLIQLEGRLGKNYPPIQK